MTIPWSEDLATGVDIIDRQHKELFSRINILLDSCTRGQGTERVAETVAFLKRYVIAHFETEELVMQRARYAGFEQHRAMHREFRGRIDALAREIFIGGVGPHTVVQVNRTVVDWLNNHIRKTDKAMAAKLREEFGVPVGADA